MDDQKERVLVVDDSQAPLGMIDSREAALRRLYPDEPRGLDTITINFGSDPRIVEAERDLRTLRRVAMVAETEAVRREYAERDERSVKRLAAARAKREQRQARNLRAR